MQAPTVHEALEAAGYQLTDQRKLVVRRCLERSGHFTADDLIEQDSPSERPLSRATVYNTLRILVEVGFLRKLDEVGSASVYEVSDSSHPHGRCHDCGRLIDLPVDLEREVQRWDLPFQVESVRMTVDGRCESCAGEHPVGTL